jgi:hypothetical protein
VRVFIIAYEEGPELDALVKVVAERFEVDADIKTLVTALAGAFGVSVAVGRVPELAEPVIRGLLLRDSLALKATGSEQSPAGFAPVRQSA